MQIFLIGHRGTGKTSLLQRLQIYGRGTLPVFDLDREIARLEGQSVSDLFQKNGEAAFRQLEHQVLNQLIKKNPKMICALGAGFELGSFVFPANAELVWVRRATDVLGRIFLDRPVLDRQSSPLSEFHNRAKEREKIYREQADWTYLLPEGLLSPDEFEKAIWGARLKDTGGILTLLPQHLRHPQVFKLRVAQIDPLFFELRDDLLSLAQLEMAMELLPREKILVSLRKKNPEARWAHASAFVTQVDFALELGDQPPVITTCVSWHQEDSSVLEKFESKGLHLKWSPLVSSFAELNQGFEWQQKNPDGRSFLPRSDSGRWSWFRLLMKGRQKFNFFRDGEGSSLDQPTLHEWIRSVDRPQKFAAVLGDPVRHSYSPMEHLEFARQHRLDFLPIEISESEWNEAMPLLEKWGLQFAAVTSPLKIQAFEFAKQKTELAEQLQSVNTLTKTKDSGFSGDNTDSVGFKEMLRTSPLQGASVIWGGGGTLSLLKTQLPEATPFSSRTGLPRDAQDLIPEQIDTLVWAAAPGALLPPRDWRPRQVFDLNYRDDSKAKQYAKDCGARYISGLVMFKAQAAQQREIWEKNVEQFWHTFSNH